MIQTCYCVTFFNINVFVLATDHLFSYLYTKVSLSMNIEQAREYCISKPYSEESFPFDDTTLVLKVGGKMFALISLEGDNTMNLKCPTEKISELIALYQGINPGYHMSKNHWITVMLQSDLSDSFIRELIDQSYTLIVNNLPKKVRDQLQ